MESIFDQIEKKQLDLMEHYIAIEGLPRIPLNLNEKPHQKIIKDFIYRMIEELSESHEELLTIKDLAENNVIGKRINLSAENYYMELADFLHFFFEVIIFTGKSELYYFDLYKGLIGADMPDEDLIIVLFKHACLNNIQDNLVFNIITSTSFRTEYGIFYISDTIIEHSERILFNIIHYLAKAGHSLRKRDWHQTSEQISNTLLFEDNMLKALASFIKLVAYIRLSPISMLDIYMKKNKINLKRITDGY